MLNLTDGKKDFYKFGITEDGCLWFSYSTDGLTFDEPYLFEKGRKEAIFWKEVEIITLEGTLISTD